ncbi:MAG: helix-turn-helix domain-containing protein [Defluviitaleaceae bacterium]|nr:helix-turn-helix domain-containing protein [Defluviitaleaceae bacterium]
MYKLLMVDDERLIADLLYEYLSQKLEGETELYKAYSGRSAVAIMEEIQIDILVTDITMPGISGLELHQKAKEINPSCQIIFLTGYNDFSHIQYALRHESADYILKSESNDVICASIRKAMGELDAALDAERVQLLAKQQWALSMPILHERIIHSLLDGEAYNSAAFTEIEFPLNIENPVLLMMGRIDEGYSMTKNTLYKLKNAVKEYLRPMGDVFSIIEGNDLLWIIQPSLASTGTAKSNLKSKMDMILKLTLQSFNVSMPMVISEDFVAFDMVSHTWHGLKQTIKNLYGLSSGMMLIEHNSKQSNQNGAWLRIRNIIRQINLSTETLQRDKYEKHYAELIKIIDTSEISQAEQIEIAIRIYLAFLSHSNNNGIKQEVVFQDYFSYPKPWEKYNELFGEIADDFFTKQHESAFRNTNQILGDLKRYIQANLGGDTSLGTLAELVHFSPSYLSRLFKQVTNTSLTEYIGRLKYKEAAELLRNSDMKILQIASELGFETQSYFSRFFKKYAGVGPQEYRDMIEG